LTSYSHLFIDLLIYFVRKFMDRFYFEILTQMFNTFRQNIHLRKISREEVDMVKYLSFQITQSKQ
jgi:hypothetical protein